MSAFVVLLSRTDSPLKAGDLEPLLARLDHRGPDGVDVVCRTHALLGHQHHWTTPEELGERQPLHDPETGVDLVFDGRLDNRAELAASLGLRLETGDGALSDAELLLHAWSRWGEGCFEHLLGPFAAAIVDARRRRVVCCRDALGDRGLVYVVSPDLIAIASEERALLALPHVSSRINEGSVARFLAVEAPLQGETFFADVQELPPGHAMGVDDRGLRIWSHWQPESLTALRYRRDADYIAQYHELLVASVACRLRAVGPPAVLMSGGLDSTSVAAIAARQLREQGSPTPLHTISWVFDELEEADEREFIDSMAAEHGLDATYIVSDDLWPLSDPSTWPSNPNAPYQNLYRRPLERAWAAARSGGAVTLLNGESGDQLYSGPAYWLRDFLADGQLGRALAAAVSDFTDPECGWHENRAWLRAALSHLIPRRHDTAGACRPWLTPFAKEAVGGPSVPPPGPRRRPNQSRLLLSPEAARGTSHESATSARAGIETRRPYRDRRLVEFALRAPAYLFYRDGWFKWILRQAMKGILPENVRLRRRVSTLMPLSIRGLVEREAAEVQRLLSRPDAVWPRFVSAAWLLPILPEVFRTDCVDAHLAWRCLCLELWVEHLERLS